jgi:hypothetical protein
MNWRFFVLLIATASGDAGANLMQPPAVIEAT